MLVIVNGERRELDPGATVATAVEAVCDPRATRGIAVAVDGEVVPRGAWDKAALNEGSRVEIVAAVQGG